MNIKFKMLLILTMMLFGACNKVVDDDVKQSSSSSRLGVSSSEIILTCSDFIESSDSGFIYRPLEKNEVVKVSKHSHFDDFFARMYGEDSLCLGTINCDGIDNIPIYVALDGNDLLDLVLINDTLEVSVELHFNNLPTLFLSDRVKISEADFGSIVETKLYIDPDSIVINLQTSDESLTIKTELKFLEAYGVKVIVDESLDSLDLSIDEMNQQKVLERDSWVGKIKTNSGMYLYIYYVGIEIEERFYVVDKNTGIKENANDIGRMCLGMNICECFYDTDAELTDSYTLSVFYAHWFPDEKGPVGKLDWKIWNSWPADVDWYNGE